MGLSSESREDTGVWGRKAGFKSPVPTGQVAHEEEQGPRYGLRAGSSPALTEVSKT